MTNEELDCARATEAVRLRLLPGLWQHETVIAARLAREGWTPPVAVDPDLAEAREIVAQIYDVSWPERADAIRTGGQDNNVENVCALAGIKRGRAFAAEAKPGMVWVKHDGSGKSPVGPGQQVWLRLKSGSFGSDWAAYARWPLVTHYAIITPPEEHP